MRFDILTSRYLGFALRIGHLSLEGRRVSKLEGRAKISQPQFQEVFLGVYRFF